MTQGPKSLKLLYSIMNLNTISLPWQARPIDSEAYNWSRALEPQYKLNSSIPSSHQRLFSIDLASANSKSKQNFPERYNVIHSILLSFQRSRSQSSRVVFLEFYWDEMVSSLQLHQTSKIYKDSSLPIQSWLCSAFNT